MSLPGYWIAIFFMQEVMSAANKQVYSTTTSAGKKPKKCGPHTQTANATTTTTTATAT